MEQNSQKTLAVRESVIGWAESIALALASIALLFAFLFRVVTVSGNSMDPTLLHGDKLVISSFFYEPKRYDIVVVDGYTAYKEPIIKRVIALAGDEVDIHFDTGEVFVNGQKLEEKYISALTKTRFDLTFPIRVPAGRVFVLGDNRPFSLDSRSSKIGFIDKRDILGKALLRIYPLGRMGAIA